MIAVGVPMMIMAGIATYFNSRASVARQSPEAAANPQTAMMNKLALYVFPLGVVVGGPFLPLAIIMYWLANNIWTFGQQHYVFGKIEKRGRGQEARGAGAAAPRTRRRRAPSRVASARDRPRRTGAAGRRGSPRLAAPTSDNGADGEEPTASSPGKTATGAEQPHAASAAPVRARARGRRSVNVDRR